MFIKKKVIVKGKHNGKYKKRKFENMVIWNVTSGDYQDQNRKSLPLEEFDMSVQEYNINRYDYKKLE